MPTEEYLKSLEFAIEGAETKEARLNNSINRLTQEINTLQGRKEEIQRSLSLFSKTETNEYFARIKTARDEYVAYQEEHREEIERFKTLSEQNEETRKGLSQQKRLLEAKEKEVTDTQDRLWLEGLEIQKKMERVVLLEDVATEEKDRAKDWRVEMRSLLEQARLKKEEVDQYENEKAEILRQKEELLDHERLITMNERRLLGNEARRLKDLERKIKDDFGQLLQAKEYIDGKLFQG